MPKRKNTDAGIYPYATQSGKRWGAVYYVDRDWASGRPRQKRKQGFLTKAEAQEWRVRQLAERNKTGRVQEPSRQPLGAYLEDWLAGMTGIAPTTLMNYTNRLARAKRALGMIPLASLTPVIIERHNADRIRNGDKPSEVRYSFRLLKRALRRAVHLGLIPANPCEPLKPPRVDPRTPTTWTLDEMRRFLESTADDPEWGTVWALLAQTWIRIGELMDLRWGDIDFAERTVTISHAMSRDANTNGDPARPRRQAASGPSPSPTRSHGACVPYRWHRAAGTPRALSLPARPPAIT
jgi:integrase